MKRKFYPLITFGFILAIFVSSMALNAQQATKLDANRTAPCDCIITIVDIADYYLDDCNEAWPPNLSTTYTGFGADCNYSDPIILTSDEGVDGNTVGCRQSRIYTFTVMDECQKEWTETTRVYRHYDETPPVIVDPNDIYLTECNQAWPEVTTTWTDNCSAGGTISGVAGDVTTEGCLQYRDYIFNVTDDCNNPAAEVSVRVTRDYDETPPEITCPDDLYLACEDDIPDPVTVTATDNCDEDVLVEYLGEVQDGNPPDAFTITRTWKATDNCENSVTCDQVIYVEACEQGGCTYTQGYWKTHSIYGPAPYDPTWVQIGEDTPFYHSGQTYYQVMWTPVRGNAYYILAHQFIAAKLNFLNGANPSAAQAEFDIAEALFNNPANTPDEIKKLKKEAKKVWTDPAGILDDYNNGDIGPGHCDDEGDRSADELTGMINTEENVSISAYPNPFMNSVTIAFTMAEDTDAVLEVYNMTGAKVASLYNGDVQANQTYSFIFEGVTHVKQETFIYVLRAGKTVKMGRLVMIK